MITDGEVKFKVVTALLQAYLDILDYDGMKSILKEAELLNLKDLRDVNPQETIEFSSFQNVIKGQNCLLYGCYRLLYEIGKKFSFYLFPFGKAFEEVVYELNDLIKTNWKVEVVEKKKNSITVEIENCVFSTEIGAPCDFFLGFLVHSLKKAIPDNRRVIYSNNTIIEPDHNTYVLILNWKK